MNSHAVLALKRDDATIRSNDCVTSDARCSLRTSRCPHILTPAKLRSNRSFLCPTTQLRQCITTDRMTSSVFQSKHATLEYAIRGRKAVRMSERKWQLLSARRVMWSDCRCAPPSNSHTDRSRVSNARPPPLTTPYRTLERRRFSLSARSCEC